MMCERIVVRATVSECPDFERGIHFRFGLSLRLSLLTAIRVLRVLLEYFIVPFEEISNQKLKGALAVL